MRGILQQEKWNGLDSRWVLAWNSHPLRLYVLETVALVFGLLTLVGLVGILLRRATISKIRRVPQRDLQAGDSRP